MSIASYFYSLTYKHQNKAETFLTDTFYKKIFIEGQINYPTILNIFLMYVGGALSNEVFFAPFHSTNYSINNPCIRL